MDPGTGLGATSKMMRARSGPMATIRERPLNSWNPGGTWNRKPILGWTNRRPLTKPFSGSPP